MNDPFLFWQIVAAALIIAGALSGARAARRLIRSSAHALRWLSLIPRMYTTLCWLAAVVGLISLVGWLAVPPVLAAGGLSQIGSRRWEQGRPSGPALCAASWLIVAGTALTLRAPVGHHSRIRSILTALVVGHLLAAVTASLVGCLFARTVTPETPPVAASPAADPADYP